MKIFTAAFLFVVLSCANQNKSMVSSTPKRALAVKSETTPSQSELASKGVQSESLKTLLQDHWQWMLKQYPIFASERGDHRYADKLPDVSQKAGDQATSALKSFVKQASNIDSASLSAGDAQTLSLFTHQLETDLATNVCKFDMWQVRPFSPLLYTIHKIATVEKFESPEDLEHVSSRLNQVPHLIETYKENFRLGLKEALVSNQETLERTIAMFKNETDKTWQNATLTKKLKSELKQSKIDKAIQSQFLKGGIDASLERAHLELRSYTQFLETEVLPHARTEGVGLTGLSLGKSCYQATIFRHLGTPTPPIELHRLGLNELKKINAEMASLGQRLFGLNRLKDITKHLRTDPSLYFESEEAVYANAEQALEKSRNALEGVFGVKPKTDCVVEEIPSFQAPFSTIAYYEQPNANGKPGTYFVNTFEPKTRPKFEAEVLAFHESIPGHHLQIAIAQEVENTPAFRKHMGSTAFVEGWALYTEQLADEMNLYTGDLDRMGKLSYDAWRASRLVVDTGIHHLGWSRTQAEDFMKSHTALTESNIKNEVNRYISWPGQALAYKVGQLEILRLRKKAKEALGDAFKLSEFHDVVLSSGAVTLPVLNDNIDRWLATKSR